MRCRQWLQIRLFFWRLSVYIRYKIVYWEFDRSSLNAPLVIPPASLVQWSTNIHISTVPRQTRNSSVLYLKLTTDVFNKTRLSGTKTSTSTIACFSFCEKPNFFAHLSQEFLLTSLVCNEQSFISYEFVPKWRIVYENLPYSTTSLPFPSKTFDFPFPTRIIKKTFNFLQKFCLFNRNPWFCTKMYHSLHRNPLVSFKICHCS